MRGARVAMGSAADLAWVVPLEELCFSRACAWGAKQFRRELARAGARLAVIDLNAFVLYRRWGGRFEIHDLVVRPSWRGRGAGRALMEHVIREAKQHEGFRVFLEVECSNRRAIGLYESLGFVVTGFLEDYYEKDGHAFEMALLGDQEGLAPVGRGTGPLLRGRESGSRVRFSPPPQKRKRMDKDCWQELIDDIRAQRECRLPGGDWESKLDRIKCELRHGARVFWYYREDKDFAEECGGDPRIDCPYSGIVVALPDTELRSGQELEWEDCAIIVDSYPVEKCYPEVYWTALGRILDNDDLVELFDESR
jgi:ribosomal-protein-alanine N-acetyltransferase